MTRRAAAFTLAGALACTVQPSDSGEPSGGGLTQPGDGTEDTSGGTSETGTSASTTGSADTESLFDVGVDTETGGPLDRCKVGQSGDAPMACDQQAPPDSFSPELQWSWDGQDGNHDSIATPLVANLTDDNDDGVIDLCDVPDVVVLANEGLLNLATLYVLDGATGIPHFGITSVELGRASTPAIGDIDGDGLPEIVAVQGGYQAGRVVAFEHDGTMKWLASDPVLYLTHSIALADLDADGDVEILANNVVLDHDGNHLFTAADPGTGAGWTTTTAADLDDDGDLEVVLGRSAYHHDGTELYFNASEVQGHPHVANLDGDPDPEILLVTEEGLSLLEIDGTTVYSQLKPTGDIDWRRPAAVHDLDGDGVSEYAVSSSETYSVFEGDATLVWSAPVSDYSGLASGTAFDFLGDGVAEAIYADESFLFVFGDAGQVLMSVPRSSGTLVEYPVVADVDNDGSAEIAVVSNKYYDESPMVQVFRDQQDRWIQARRIWNQHTYHVTNVREDATIPQHEPQHWKHLNTFRTNAQIEGGVVCKPEG